MNRIGRSLFTLSMVAVIIGLGSLYVQAQALPTYQTYYGVLEIVPGIRLTPEFGEYQLFFSSAGLNSRNVSGIEENVIRPDGTFLFRYSRIDPGYKNLMVVRGVSSGELNEEQIVSRTYFYVSAPERYPNPGYPFLPSITVSLGQQVSENTAHQNGGIKTLSFPNAQGIDLGTIVLTKPGSITGRIILVNSPAVEMADLVVAIPQFGLVTKPNPDGGYLLTGVPPGTWNARLMGPGIRETRDTVRLTYVAAMNPSVGVNFTIRGQNVPAASQIDPSNVPLNTPSTGALQGSEKEKAIQEQKESEKTPDKQRTSADIDKEKVIQEVLNKIPKKP